MVYKRFLVIVLGLLYVMNAIWGSYADHDHRDWEMNKYEQLGPEEIDLPAHKELDGFSSTASTRKMALGRRKMAVQKVARREIEKDQQGLHGGVLSEDNSGKEKNASDKSLEGSKDQLNNNNKQKDKNNSERKTLSGRLGAPRTESVHLPNPELAQDSKALPTKTSLESLSRAADMGQEPKGSSTTHPKGEMQRLIDATVEIVNLMHKDYSGHGRPARKPPVNNEDPIH
ncbi:Exocyst complex component [Salix suchowensis]|nr:Exocyst complex component [Salix suchowensis]